MAAEGRIAVVVAYAPQPRQVYELALELPPGSTVAEALAASGLAAKFPELDLKQVDVGVWGRKASRERVLREDDRVEVYRALRVDPKVARRERFARQGARSVGLFAQRRPGAKAGY
ncbi:MAG: RnfH family protein [Curvibacter sp.]|jgi:putative ubiquitin-RnfH superfamily antitoxin RatB of RatAB toxin-antitoxin module|nr:RnfH family protein [Curvibacter sp.]